MKLLAYFFLLLISSSLYSQLKVENVLSQPLSINEMSQVLAREDFLSTHKFNSPWLRDVDVRVRSNDQEIGLEDYKIRFSFLNPFEIRANKDYRKMLMSQQSFERKKTINEVLLSRYELLIEANFLYESINTVKEHLGNLTDIKSIILTENFNLSDALDLEHEITKTELSLSELNQKVNIINQVFSYWGFNEMPDWDLFTWVSTDQMIKLLDTNSDEPSSMSLLNKKQKLAQEESIMTIKKAESRSNIGFVQAEYDLERGNEFQEHIGFQIGVSIPIFNSDKPDLQRRKLELIEDKASISQFAEDEKQEKNLEMLRITELINQSRMIEKKIVSLQELKKLIDESQPDIDNYQKITEYEFFLKSKQVSYYGDIRSRYIKLLSDQGKLSDQPYLNYISFDLSNFDLLEEDL